MKRRTSITKRRAELQRAKESGMQNPSGQSRYALKKKGVIAPKKGSPGNRPSWFLRYHVDRHTRH